MGIRGVGCLRTGEEEACEAPAMRPIPELHDEPCQQQEPTEAKRPKDLVAAPGEQIRKLARRTLHPPIFHRPSAPRHSERVCGQRFRDAGREDNREGRGRPRAPYAARARVCRVCRWRCVVRTGEREGGEDVCMG